MELKFGVHYPGGSGKPDIRDFAERCEALGLHSLWFRESALGGDPFVPLAAAAASCELLLGTAVVVLPFRNPVLTARTVASLDQLSGGRLLLGVGVGGERRREFAAYDIPVGQRGQRADESLQLMLRLWQESDVSFDGQFYKGQGVSLAIKPVQAPHPPLWIGGRLGGRGRYRDAALRRLARFGNGWLPYLVTPEQYAAGLERLSLYLSQAGRTDASITRALQVNIAIYASRAEALQVIREGSARAYGLSVEQLEQYYAFGHAEDVANRLAEFAATGVEHFVFQWACRREDISNNLDELCEAVLPLVLKKAA